MRVTFDPGLEANEVASPQLSKFVSWPRKFLCVLGSTEREQKRGGSEKERERESEREREIERKGKKERKKERKKGRKKERKKEGTDRRERQTNR